MVEPLFLQPVFQERIWGGTALKEKFGYPIPNEHTGECWAISAHPNGPSVVKNGEFAGKTLIELWENHPELFGDQQTKVFPLLTKILDANADLSVQVHPDDVYANKHENGELGKTECWYIIDCKEGAELIYGHNAQSKAEFINMIEHNQWDQLLRRVKIKPGDFFYVPSGTIHALGEGTLVLETQQSSDTTYRLYDYDRLGQDGKPRELHIEQSIAVSTIPHHDADVSTETSHFSGGTITKFVQEEYFSVYKWELHGKMTFEQNQPFMLVSAIEGNAILTIGERQWEIKKGDHFILPHAIDMFDLDGTITLIVSHM